MSKFEVKVPDMGGSADVEVIEICVKAGDAVEKDDSIIVLETDKATMEIPAPVAGTILEMNVSVGDRVSEDDVIMLLNVQADAKPAATDADQSDTPEEVVVSQKLAETSELPVDSVPETDPEEWIETVPESSGKVHAGPAVRKIAREFGVSLQHITGSGPNGRIIKEDVQIYVKSQLRMGTGTHQQSGHQQGTGTGIPLVTLPDFAQFGEHQRQSLSRIHKVTAENMHTSWLNVPHVTQFDQADITDMESFRLSQKAQAEARGVKLTPLPFILKACASALLAYPQFNTAIDMTRNEIICKHYVNIGFAVDTSDGLVVPVLRDVDKKGVWELAGEMMELAEKAKSKKLKPADMQGGCFTVSSLGSIGGTAFTPIVNSPEVAILGLSKASMQPVWILGEFQPRLMLPLSLSYDHRAVNGADAARFTTLLGVLLSDLRQMLL